MLNKLFKSSIRRSTCVVLYTFEYNREKTVELFEFANQYLTSHLNIEFTYASFFNESYDVNYGQMGNIEMKLKRGKASDLVNFSLHTNDLKKGLSDFNFEFNFTRPIQLTLQIPDDIGFDVLDFVRGMRSSFYPQYGFVYYPVFDKWSTAYANGDQQHVKSENGYSSFEKASMKRWFNECEKITSGYLREIFLENFINDNHLDFRLQSGSLRQVIDNNNLGVLAQVTDGFYFWKLNEVQLDQARILLYKSGILI